ncbi:MAG: hypothetical protein ONB46_14745 [candidate division KSB1 bacterium]|nr:hypothetical protein [candidate division KSB1 bacterium]MDZ7367051.1 hypothetical protein [candidate division KSB1 bacterium]MDZ7406751.1 hypothetical protein [candidate division KSB1 bacterium]
MNDRGSLLPKQRVSGFRFASGVNIFTVVMVFPEQYSNGGFQPANEDKLDACATKNFAVVPALPQARDSFFRVICHVRLHTHRDENVAQTSCLQAGWKPALRHFRGTPITMKM